MGTRLLGTQAIGRQPLDAYTTNGPAPYEVIPYDDHHQMVLWSEHRWCFFADACYCPPCVRWLLDHEPWADLSFLGAQFISDGGDHAVSE